MKKARYTLSECWKLLETDNKGLQRWLERAKIKPQTSEADHRTKYLSQEQLQQLADFLDRELPEAPPTPEEPIGPYKLLLDQVNDLHRSQQTSREQIDGLHREVNNTFDQVHEAWRTIDTVRESYEGELATLRTTVEEKSLVLQQLTDLQHQQHEDLTILIGKQQQALDLQKAHQAEQHGGHEIRLNELSHEWEQFQQDIQNRLGTLFTTFDERRQALATQIGELRDQVQCLETEMPQRIEAVKTQMQAQLTEVSSQVGTVAEQASSFSTTQNSVQHQVETLTRALKTETEQRQVLANQVTQLAEEVRRLKRPELKTPRRRKTAASSEPEARKQ